MIAIIDYGVGNMYSLTCSLNALGIENCMTRDENTIMNADKIILPGVGAFKDAAKMLRDSGLDKITIEAAKSGKPLMGICLGMQLLFEKSYEYGEHEGLGLIKGSVVPLKDKIPSSYKIPHIGWNELNMGEKKSPIFKYLSEGDCVYFVHSYYGKDCEESIIATTEYGAKITAAVQNGNVFGCQFHPEKSGKTGLSILKAFDEYNGGVL